MKHRILPVTLLLHVGMGLGIADAEPLNEFLVQQAAARVDAALVRDFQLRQAHERKQGYPPQPAPVLEIADDAVFLRRACIDIAGRLPRVDEARAFLGDPAPDKRARLTEALVKEPGAVETRFRMLAEAFRVKDDGALAAWLKQAAADDLPFDQIVTHLVGSGLLNQRDENNPLRTATEVAYAVLGEDLHCALCHDHPFNDHTVMQAYQFAACFLDGAAGETRLPKDYRYRDGKPGELVRPTLLQFTREKPPAIKHGIEPRTQVAQWLVKESSRRFATVAALRVWNSLFGMPGYLNHTTGGIDPAPSWHQTNAGPELDRPDRGCFTTPVQDRTPWIGDDFAQGPLLDVYAALGEEFRLCGYRLGEFRRVLVRTNAYNRAGLKDHGAIGMRLTPAPQIRRLPPEVVWETLSTEKSSQLQQVPPLEHPLRMLGRGTREWMDESAAPVSHELVRFMLNSPDVENAVATEPESIDIDDLFLAILGRYPSGIEKAIAQNHRLASPKTASQDIAWALLNTREFMFRP